MSKGYPWPPSLPIVDENGVPTSYFYNWLAGRSTYSGTIATAKLTPTGANGTMTFVNGQLTAEVPAT